MRDHYDFSQGVKGKYSRSNEELKVPIYLDHDVESALEQLAATTGKGINDLVNAMLKNDLALLKTMTR